MNPKIRPLSNTEKALIKDVELQIDRLVGYSYSGEHWKREYHTRQKYINDTLAGEEMPDELKHKVYRLQEKLYEMKEGVGAGQPYLKGSYYYIGNQEEKLTEKKIIFYGDKEWEDLVQQSKNEKRQVPINNFICGSTTFIEL